MSFFLSLTCCCCIQLNGFRVFGLGSHTKMYDLFLCILTLGHHALARWARGGSPHTTEPALSQGGQANCDWREAISRAFFKKKHYIVKTYYFRLTVRKLQVLMLTKEEYSINNRRSTCIYFSIFSPFLYECWNKELSKLWKILKFFKK